MLTLLTSSSRVLLPPTKIEWDVKKGVNGHFNEIPSPNIPRDERIFHPLVSEVSQKTQGRKL